MEEKEVGTVTHYFGRVNVGIIQLADLLKVGDNIHVKGHTTDFSQGIDSMQIEHVVVTEAKAGDAVGIKLSQKVHPNDRVYKVTA
ncbi:MAG: translation elongation factor-like protein [Omnitrophica bacterium RIFCSPLOWO2_01_FULL_45_10]|nr:MAG: translation elongation factor-like protein [Omnitrophica bacterium RIFCSPLOWO2_01_FULL_45_10]